MSMYNLREYSENYSKTTGSFWHYDRDESDEDDITDSLDLKKNSRKHS